MFIVKMGLKLTESSSGITAKQLDLTSSSWELIIKPKEVTQSPRRAQKLGCQVVTSPHLPFT